LTSNIDANNNLETLTLYSNQTLSGFGTVTGLVVSLNDSTVSPGSASTIGTLTVKSNTTLAGTTVMKANGTSSLSDKLVVAGTLVLGGTLNLQPVFDSTFTVGQTFTLFSATGGISGGFTNVIGNPPGFPGFGLAWNTNNLLVNGTVSVVDAGSGSVPAAPTVTGVALLGGKLVISGTKGVPNAQFVVLGTTNLALPLTNWLAVVTNNFDGSGDFSVTNISTSGAARYFTIREQ